MVEDGSGEQDGGFESVLTAVRRAKREVGLAVGHGVDGVRQWIEQRWLLVRLAFLGGFSWTMSKAFGWFLSLFVRFSSWLASSLLEVALPSTLGMQMLLLFFLVYVAHSVIQTKLILVIKTKMTHMDVDEQSKVRADGGDSQDFSSRLGAICGLLAGMIIGWSFGMDGVFVGAGVGWGLGDELDRRLEAKVHEAGRVPREEQPRIEKQ